MVASSYIQSWCKCLRFSSVFPRPSRFFLSEYPMCRKWLCQVVWYAACKTNVCESIKYQNPNQCNNSFKQHLNNDSIRENNAIKRVVYGKTPGFIIHWHKKITLNIFQWFFILFYRKSLDWAVCNYLPYSINYFEKCKYNCCFFYIYVKKY
jgi:hypothetical protein